jgi:hypothetical protein
MILALAFMLVQQSASDEESWERLKARIELAPQDVATFIERRTDCYHWNGEAGGGFREREEQVQSERRRLRCDYIASDTQKLRHKYRGRADVLELIADTADLEPW